MTTALATETVSSGQLRIKWETYLHTVTFEDATQLSDTDPPCHVTYRVLVNGEPTDLTVTEWWVEGRSHDATTVTLRIPANQCVIPRAEDRKSVV